MEQQSSSLHNIKNNQNYYSIPEDQDELMTSIVHNDTVKIIARKNEIIQPGDIVAETSLLLSNGQKKQQHNVETIRNRFFHGYCCLSTTTPTSPFLCGDRFNIKPQNTRRTKWIILLFSIVIIIILIGFIILYTNIKNDEYDESLYKTSLLKTTNNATPTTIDDDDTISRKESTIIQPVNFTFEHEADTLDQFDDIDYSKHETNNSKHVEYNSNNLTIVNSISFPLVSADTTANGAPNVDSHCSNGFWWGKKGIGFIGQYDRVLALNVDWYYNWGLQRTYPNCQQQDEYNATTTRTNLPMFIPMAWDGGISNNELEQRIVNAINNDWQNTSIYLTPIASIVFGFNEPDHTDQASMSINDGIERWNILQQTIHQYNTTYQLVSPSCALPNGQWMKSFMNFENSNNKTNTINYIGVHYYGTADFLSFQITIEGYYNEYNQIPIVITEFAPADWDAITVQDNKYTESDVLIFAQQALVWLDTTDWIMGYSWFSFDRSNPTGWTSALFYNNDNDDRIQLTPLGEFYKNFTSSRRSKCYHQHHQQQRERI